MANRGGQTRRALSAEDAAERLRPEDAAAARAEAQRLKDYAEAAADRFWEMDATLRFTRMSASSQLPESFDAAAFIGRRVGEISGLTVAGDDWQPVLDLFEARLPFRDVRLRCRIDGGPLLHLSIAGVPVFDEAGVFQGYRGIGRDLSLLVRAEEHAAIAQSRLTDAIEAIPESFLLIDADNRLVLCNSRCREINGAVLAQLAPGTRIDDLARACVERGAVPPRTGRDAAVVECQVGERWFQVSERRTREGGAVVVQTDITALKRRERELAEKTALLRATLDNMEQGLLVLDDQCRIRLWNDRAWQLFEHPPEWLWPGRPVGELVLASSGSDAQRVETGLAFYRSGVELRQPRSREMVLASGRVIDMRLTPTPDGGAIVTYLDITAQKRREQELAEKTALLRATLDDMEQGLLVLDDRLRIRLWNDRVWQLFEHPPEYLWAGRPAEDLIRQNAGTDTQRAEASIEFFRRGVAERRPATRELILPSGRVIEMRLTPMPGGGVIETFIDITAQKRVEYDLRGAKEEAELASRSKTEFLANMSHELRTPLNAIIGFAEILRGETFGRLGDRRYVDYAGDICDSGEHLLKLINDVLDVSKVEFGKIELAEEAVEVTALLEGSIRLMRDRAAAAGVTLEHTIPPDLPPLQADGLRLKQIVLNLLSNAVKFTPPGGSISVHAAADACGLSIVIADTGIGIKPADLAKALRPFGQIDSRLARKYQGTGLGLPLAKSMVELHGGRLVLDSTPGVGTKAIVWLPPERIVFPADLRLRGTEQA